MDFSELSRTDRQRVAVGAWLGFVRARYSWRQADVAQLADVSPSLIGLVERGLRTLPPRAVSSFARAQATQLATHQADRVVEEVSAEIRADVESLREVTELEQAVHAVREAYATTMQEEPPAIAEVEQRLAELIQEATTPRLYLAQPRRSKVLGDRAAPPTPSAALDPDRLRDAAERATETAGWRHAETGHGEEFLTPDLEAPGAWLVAIDARTIQGDWGPAVGRASYLRLTRPTQEGWLIATATLKPEPGQLADICRALGLGLIVEHEGAHRVAVAPTGHAAAPAPGRTRTTEVPDLETVAPAARDVDPLAVGSRIVERVKSPAIAGREAAAIYQALVSDDASSLLLDGGTSGASSLGRELDDEQLSRLSRAVAYAYGAAQLAVFARKKAQSAIDGGDGVDPIPAWIVSDLTGYSSLVEDSDRM